MTTKLITNEKILLTHTHTNTPHVRTYIRKVSELGKLGIKQPVIRHRMTARQPTSNNTCYIIHTRILLRYQVTWFMNIKSNLISHSTKKSVVIYLSVTAHIHILGTQYMT